MSGAVEHNAPADLPRSLAAQSIAGSDAVVASIAGPAGDPQASEPLVRTPGAALPYPVHALGPLLGPATEAIVERTRCAPATAANASLAAAALVAQPHRNVRLPHGQVVPISLNFATVCESGERKTSADQLALAAVREMEAHMQDAHRKAWPAYANHRDAYAAERASIIAKKGDLTSRRAALDALGTEPQAPLAPYLLVPEPTIEGLMKAWADAPAALGLFMDEGGQFLGGYSMSKDHRLKTITQLSRLWDGSAGGRLRAGDGASVLLGRRLACHLMLQPGVAASLFADEAVWDQGLMARFLSAAPLSLAGQRKFRRADMASNEALDRYHAALATLLNLEPRTSDDRNQLDPPVMELCSEAEALWIAFHDAVDAKCVTNGAYADIRGLASKAPNHAARIAAVLTLIEKPEAMEIAASAMANAIELLHFYLHEALRLRQSSLVDERMAKAETLRLWLLQWPEDYISASDVARLGPNAIRDVETVRDLMGVLHAHGAVEPAQRQTVAGRTRKETWRILRAVNDR